MLFYSAKMNMRGAYYFINNGHGSGWIDNATKGTVEKKNEDSTPYRTNIPLISLIVPIYNVEKYLRKCLDSLLQQTIKQIEVICIDDGSTDKSGRIADEYESNEYPVFRVIHTTENRGLSAARNRGLNEARAEWIMFVDSDDWVDKDFCRVPYEAAKENQADMVIFGWYDTNGFRIKKSNMDKAQIGIIDEDIAHQHGEVVVWNKLYNRNIFKNIEFPVSRVSEDVAIIAKCIHASRRTIGIEDRLYYHLIRKGSLSNSHSKQYKRDGAIAAWERYQSLKSYEYSEDKLRPLEASASIGILANLSPEHPLYLEAREVVDSIGSITELTTFTKKVALIVWKISPRLFTFLCKITGRRTKHSCERGRRLSNT